MSSSRSSNDVTGLPASGTVSSTATNSVVELPARGNDITDTNRFGVLDVEMTSDQNTTTPTKDVAVADWDIPSPPAESTPEPADVGDTTMDDD